MKPLLPYRSYDTEASRILARLRNADSEFAKKQKVLRNHCAQLLRWYRHRQVRRAQVREANFLSDILRQTEEWKQRYQLAEEQKISEVVRTVLSVFLKDDAQSRGDHVIREIRTMLYSQPVNQIVSLRVSPELEKHMRSTFPQFEIVPDPQLRGSIIVQTASGEMEYSWHRHLHSILDLLSS